eukprot:TRINITY_DN2549_c0_g1_i1.p1 TRINITY_DN2549_c0_g1~~TRINITY_DN2549_c0_g1_i1.p1  ORF type:complete len:410 (+),score=107.70 TRINITY_DN2549_c0_g1_i1:65-1231(+)
MAEDPAALAALSAGDKWAAVKALLDGDTPEDPDDSAEGAADHWMPTHRPLATIYGWQDEQLAVVPEEGDAKAVITGRLVTGLSCAMLTLADREAVEAAAQSDLTAAIGTSVRVVGSCGPRLQLMVRVEAARHHVDGLLRKLRGIVHTLVLRRTQDAYQSCTQLEDEVATVMTSLCSFVQSGANGADAALTAPAVARVPAAAEVPTPKRCRTRATPLVPLANDVAETSERKRELAPLRAKLLSRVGSVLPRPDADQPPASADDARRLLSVGSYFCGFMSCDVPGERGRSYENFELYIVGRANGKLAKGMYRRSDASSVKEDFCTVRCAQHGDGSMSICILGSTLACEGMLAADGNATGCVFSSSDARVSDGSFKLATRPLPAAWSMPGP